MDLRFGRLYAGLARALGAEQVRPGDYFPSLDTPEDPQEKADRLEQVAAGYERNK